MPVFTVAVKWGKETFKDIELDSDESPEVFQAQLFALTSVAPDRQKVMLKGAILKPGGDWSKFKLANGSKIMMMGTVGELAAPPPKVVFLEDLSEADIAGAGIKAPGLVNLGNTCYMNATLQCLRAAPELETALMRFAQQNPAQQGPGPAGKLTRGLGELFAAMQGSPGHADAVRDRTMMFLMLLRTLNPQFAQQTHGHYSQQDANECWGAVMTAVKQGLGAAGGSFVDQYFGVAKVDTMTCAEAPEEPPSISSSHLLQLSCHIEKDTGFVMAGLQKSLVAELEKTSPTLGRNAIYQTKSALSRLPTFLTVNFVRFYFKQDAQENCKIRKEVKFSMNLDLHDLCSTELKAKLKPARSKFHAYGDWETEAAADGKYDPKTDKTPLFEPSSFADDVGSNNSGEYELVSVLTHKGRSSDSGHYVGWAKQDDGHWLMFDDDKVSPVTEAEVMKLSGGGGADWHTAYTCLYKSRRCKTIKQLPSGDSASATAMDTTADS